MKDLLWEKYYKRYQMREAWREKSYGCSFFRCSKPCSKWEKQKRFVFALFSAGSLACKDGNVHKDENGSDSHGIGFVTPFTTFWLQYENRFWMFSYTNTKRMPRIRKRIRIFTGLEDNIYQFPLLIIYNYKIM
jgi:hypothetical protein